MRPDYHQDRADIHAALCGYARGVDRADWALVRAAFHADAHNAHGQYNGSVDGFIEWLQSRFAGVTISSHVLNNCLVEFAGPDLALAETYFEAVRPPLGRELQAVDAGTDVWMHSRGRYIDRFERREGHWRIARRRTVIDMRYRAVHPAEARDADSNWGSRDASDPLHLARAEMFGSR